MTDETNKPKKTTSKAKARKTRVKKATETKAEKVEAVEAETVESFEQHNEDSEFAEEASAEYKAEHSSASSESQERVYEGEAEVLGAQETSSEEKTWSMMAHLSALVALVPIIGWIGMIVGPLAIWLLKKGESTLIGENAKEALNFNITMFIAYCVAVILCITIIGLIIGIPLLIALPIFHLVVIIIAAVKSNEGEVYKYPYSLKLVQ